MSAKTNIAAIVLAAGKGTRMGSDLHKVLHALDGKPMLGHVLDNLAKLDVARKVVVVGADRDQIAAAFPGLDTVVQDKQLGTGHAVHVAAGALMGFEGVVLVLYGDVPLISAKTMRRLCDKVTSGAGVAVLGFRPEDAGAYGRLLTDDIGALERIVEFAEADTDERAIGFCNSGILAADADAIFKLLPLIENNNAKGEYYLTDIVALARAEGLQVVAAEAETLEVTGVNSPEELAALERSLAAPSNEDA